MTDKIVASALASVPHLTAILDTAEAYIKRMDLKPVLMYLIDTTSAEALPYLAEQLDVLGYKGWALTTNEQEQRELLKKAIELHRYKGTPWAIKEALKSVGFGSSEISEGLPLFFYDGTYNYDGSQLHDGGVNNWAVFSAQVVLGNTKGLSLSEIETARRLIEEYKPARSRLISLSFLLQFNDNISINDGQLSYTREPLLGSDDFDLDTNSDMVTLRVVNAAGSTTQVFSF